jgi:hypothetical protein
MIPGPLTILVVVKKPVTTVLLSITMVVITVQDQQS